MRVRLVVWCRRGRGTQNEGKLDQNKIHNNNVFIKYVIRTKKHEEQSRNNAVLRAQPPYYQYLQSMSSTQTSSFLGSLVSSQHRGSRVIIRTRKDNVLMFDYLCDDIIILYYEYTEIIISEKYLIMIAMHRLPKPKICCTFKIK